MADAMPHCCSRCQKGVDMESLNKREDLAYVLLTDSRINVNGREIGHERTGNAMLSELYRAQIGDWAKFFKMDTLSKVGFCASELLLKDLGVVRCGGEEYVSNVAVVLFGTTASLCADKNYQATISARENYFPSPALFVYTLPNIVTGEISIRNHYRGETSFYVTDGIDAAQLARHISQVFCDKVTECVLTGWIDCNDNDSFSSFFTMVDRGQASDCDWLEKQIGAIASKM